MTTNTKTSELSFFFVCKTPVNICTHRSPRLWWSILARDNNTEYREMIQRPKCGHTVWH